MSTTLAYYITAEAIAAERARVQDDLTRVDFTRLLTLGERPLGRVGPGDLKLKILAVSAEHNVLHAALADTVNIVVAQGGRLYPGNSAVAEVVEVGSGVTRFAPGDIVATHCNGLPDRHGYPERIWGYDLPGSVGWYAEQAVVAQWQVVALPLECGLGLWELAALPLRAPTAYHLWRRAHGTYRVKVSAEKQARLNVLAFGGGVSELFLLLAKAAGHQAYFCSGNPERRAALAERGINTIDQEAFQRFATDGDVERFRTLCRQLTNAAGMHIVCDMFRGPLFAAGLAVAARQGVNVSAGWQLGQTVTYNSALLSLKQLSLEHVHYETIDGCRAVTELYGPELRPKLHSELYTFDALPRCLQEAHENVHTGIPVIRVAQQLPAAVLGMSGSA